MGPGEGSSRPALFLQVRVHQLSVNDPVHVILQRAERRGLSSSDPALGVGGEVANVGSTRGEDDG